MSIGTEGRRVQVICRVQQTNLLWLSCFEGVSVLQVAMDKSELATNIIEEKSQQWN